MANITLTHPELIEEWHPTKNGDLKAENFTYGSDKSVWWLCTKTKTCNKGCLHEWEMPIVRRTGAYALCPYCSNPEKNCCIHTSFAYLHSALAKEWHPTKNGKFKPEEIAAWSNRNIWWLCDKTCNYGCKHEWQTSITRRIKGAGCCPYCIKQKICIHHSIVYTHPELIKKWHPTKNGTLTPDKVSPSSGNQPIWVICDKHGDYSAYVYNIIDRIGCPLCLY
jgi:hypothetical protein